MTSVLAIDPGTSRSGWLRFDGARPRAFGITANETLLRALRTGGLPDVIVIEEVRSYGMPVGQEVFDTVRWTGRFEEAAHRVPVALVGRKEIVVENDIAWRIQTMVEHAGQHMGMAERLVVAAHHRAEQPRLRHRGKRRERARCDHQLH